MIQRQFNFSLLALVVSLLSFIIVNHHQFCQGASVDGRQYSGQQSNLLVDSSVASDTSAFDAESPTLTVSEDSPSSRVKRQRNADTCDRWGQRQWLQRTDGLWIDGTRNSRAENCRLACRIDGCGSGRCSSGEVFRKCICSGC